LIDGGPLGPWKLLISGTVWICSLIVGALTPEFAK